MDRDQRSKTPYQFLFIISRELDTMEEDENGNEASESSSSSSDATEEPTIQRMKLSNLIQQQTLEQDPTDNGTNDPSIT
jgi:hypothetical protein